MKKTNLNLNRKEKLTKCWSRCDSLHSGISGAGKGGKGGQLPPPMLKKTALVILPNSMRKSGGVGGTSTD